MNEGGGTCEEESRSEMAGARGGQSNWKSPAEEEGRESFW